MANDITITLALTERQAACLYDEVAGMMLDVSPGLNRYEKDLSRTAAVVRKQLEAQGVTGVLAASPNAHF